MPPLNVLDPISVLNFIGWAGIGYVIWRYKDVEAKFKEIRDDIVAIKMDTVTKTEYRADLREMKDDLKYIRNKLDDKQDK